MSYGLTCPAEYKKKKKFSTAPASKHLVLRHIYTYMFNNFNIFAMSPCNTFTYSCMVVYFHSIINIFSMAPSYWFTYSTIILYICLLPLYNKYILYGSKLLVYI